MSKRCELQKEYYQQHGNYKGNGKYRDKYVSWLENKVMELRADVNISEKLLEERDRLLESIPECNIHGKCVPHAIEWVESKKNHFHEEPISDAELKKYNEEVEESLTNARMYIALVVAVAFTLLICLIITFA